MNIMGSVSIGAKRKRTGHQKSVVAITQGRITSYA